MLPNEFFRNLDRGNIAPVYLFIGEADLLMEEAWVRLLGKIVPPGNGRFNGERFTAKDYPAGAMAADLRMMPMFGAKRVLMVRHIEEWPEDQKKILLAYLKQPYPTACLVLTFSGKKSVEKIESSVEAAGGGVVRFRAPGEKEVSRWVQDRARQRGKNLSAPAAAALASLVGTDLQLLESELEKLITYAGDNDAITPEDVRQVVSSQRAYSIFELLDAIAAHRSSRAIACLNSLITDGQSPLAILGMLTKHIRNLWQVKDGLEKGMALPQIARKAGLHPFVAGKHQEQAPRFSERELFRLHQAMRETDMALKSSLAAPETILEELVLRLSLHKKAPE